MSTRQFTDEQLRAINTRNCDLLISAAAGSGKTAVLVERIMRIILNEKQPVYIDRLLVVTFTEAAAAEMRQRITKAISDKLKTDPKNTHLKKQAILLTKSSIMTIHSFCLSVIRKYFHLIGLDPNFRVADPTETELIKLEVLRDLFDELYENENPEFNAKLFGNPNNTAFLNLVELYGDKIKDDALMRLILDLHAFAEGNPWPEIWLSALADTYDISSIDDMNKTKWYGFFREDSEIILNSALSAAKRNIAMADTPAIPDKYADVLRADYELVKNCLSALQKSPAAFYDALCEGFGSLTSAKSKAAHNLSDEEVKRLRDSIKRSRDSDVKGVVSGLKSKAFPKPPSEMLADFRRSRGTVKALCSIIIEFSKRFSEEKRERNIADFSDFEHYCLRALITPDGVTEAARELRERYDEIYIDEYQDSNLTQELILSSVSRKDDGKPNTFMVGDIKQSIYRFRLANPDIFNAKYKAFKNGETEGGSLVTLSKNFRSRKNIINAVNCIFRQIMSADLGGTEYDESAALNFGAEYYCGDVAEHVAELLIINTGGDDESEFRDDYGEDGGAESEADNYLDELSKTEVEAKAVAARIKQMLNKKSPFMVTDMNNAPDLRPAERSDIAIILRSPRMSADIFVRELKKLDIRAFSDASSGFFDSGEIMTALSFLQIIDNPRQDIPLAAVLFSHVYGFSGEELMLIRGGLSGGVFFDAVKDYAQNGTDGTIRARLNHFLCQLEQWRAMSVHAPVSELLWAVLEESGQNRESGGVRRQNLTALFELAVKYEKTSLKGLFHFLRYVEKLQKNSDGMVVGKAPAEAFNAVRVISAHKSKGLEFPIVFVCELGKQFNLTDTRRALLMHNDLGLGVKSFDADNRIISDTLTRYVVSKKIFRENMSEELRVLYVALTRAREKLVLVGSAAWEGRAEALAGINEINGINIPPGYMLKNKTFLDFITQALARHKDGFSCADGIDDPSRWAVSIIEKTDALAYESYMGEVKSDLSQCLKSINPNEDYSGYKNDIIKRLTFEYGYKASSKIPRKLSVTEIKRIYYSEDIKDSGHLGHSAFINMPVPGFISSKTPLDAASRGTLLHIVMERLDIKSCRTRNDVLSLVEALTNAGLIRPADAGYVDVNAITAFLSSSLAERMRNAAYVKREQQFVINMNSSEINPEWSVPSGEMIMVHGVIDCMFEEGGEIVLADYKTDAETDAFELAERYRIQLEIYARAAERFTGKRVKQIVIYSFTSNSEITL